MGLLPLENLGEDASGTPISGKEVPAKIDT